MVAGPTVQGSVSTSAGFGRRLSSRGSALPETSAGSAWNSATEVRPTALMAGSIAPHSHSGSLRVQPERSR